MVPAAEDCHANMRDLLASARTPFTVAGYAPRATLFRQGDAGDSVMYIEHGRVRLAVTVPSGREASCGLLEAGEFLGEDALTEGTARRETAIALTATDVLVVPRERMITLIREKPYIQDRFLTHVLARNRRLELDLIDQLLHSSEQRLARILFRLAGGDRSQSSRCALPPVSQELIAEMVGTTRSRVNLFMGRFKKLGLIEETADGSLQIKRALMRVVHDGL
jgi:CRP-like cAMP-binding protein